MTAIERIKYLQNLSGRLRRRVVIHDHEKEPNSWEAYYRVALHEDNVVPTGRLPSRYAIYYANTWIVLTASFGI